MSDASYITKLPVNKSSLWKKAAPVLSRLDIELTERCNNNCVHCCINLPAKDPQAKKKELSTAQVKRILTEAVSLGCMLVRFTGGEPLLREDFEELYVFARRSGLKVIVFTNATLINERLAELFWRIPPLEKLEVTVYGMKKDSYEAVSRVPGSFESAWRGIRFLLERKIPFAVKGALLPANTEEIDEFEEWARGIPWMEDEPPRYSMFFDLRCRRDGPKNESIIKVRVSAQEALRVIIRRKEKYLKEMKEFCAKFIQPSGEEVFSCGAGCGSGCVDAYGNLQLCMMLRHPQTVYDLRNGSLKDALENFFPGIRKIKAANSDYLARCAKCFLRGFCEQCPAKSWAEHGTLDTPVEYFCGIAHSQARFLGLLKERENAWKVRDWKARIGKFTSN